MKEDTKDSINFIAYILEIFGIGYLITLFPWITAYLIALQCKSIDGLTNLAEATPFYVWIGAYLFIGFIVSIIILFKEGEVDV